jgi:hypothetical protein
MKVPHGPVVLDDFDDGQPKHEEPAIIDSLNMDFELINSA